MNLTINSKLEIPTNEIQWRFSRSSGAGGQNVNKTDTRVEIVFNISDSKTLTPYHKHRILIQGKIKLINAIKKTGSISEAAKMMGMSYRRAWNLVDRMNRDFSAEIIITSSGGRGGGGAIVSAFGLEIIEQYQKIEAKALDCVNDDLHKFHSYLIEKSINKLKLN